MSGRHNLCLHGDFMSSPTAPGYFRDRVNLPAANLLPLPKNLGFAEATLYEPIAIVLHSFRFAQPQVGENVAVFGTGPIGLATIACLRLAGVRRIWAVEPVQHRRELAVELGADVAIDPRQTDPVAEIRRDTGRGVHLAIDCATKEDTINQCLRVARPGGRVCITGVPSEVRVPLEFHTMRSKELGFYSVRRSNHVSEPALELLSGESRRFTPMISHRHLLDEVQQCFETLESYADGAVKMVLYPR
jgi:threonine dehydrogenase-like Zn-dependent dehydrogenase